MTEIEIVWVTAPEKAAAPTVAYPPGMMNDIWSPYLETTLFCIVLKIVIWVPDAVRKPNMHCFTNHSSKSSSNFECWNEDSRGNRKCRGDDREKESGDNIDSQWHKYAFSDGVSKKIKILYPVSCPILVSWPSLIKKFSFESKSSIAWSRIIGKVAWPIIIS